LEFEEATGKIGPCIAFKFQHNWLFTSFDPDVAPNDSFRAVIDFATNDAVMNSEGHSDRPTLSFFLDDLEADFG
jgi:hypothetical protein